MTDPDNTLIHLGRGRTLAIAELAPPLVACVALIDFLNARDRFIIDRPLQQLIVATVLRSFGTFQVICSALVDGLPTQASMLCRPLFEDLVVAHWILLNREEPDWLLQRFTDHRDAMALYQAKLTNETGWRFGEPLAEDTTALRRRQNQLFKEFGGEAQRNWWDPGEDGSGQGNPIGLRAVAAKLEQAAERHELFHPRLAGGEEPLLSRMELVAYKWFTQSLHHTALGLPIEIVEPGSVPGILGDPSGLVAFSAWWMFSQQLYLLHDLYETDPRDLNVVVRSGFIDAFGAPDDDLKPWPT